MTTVIIPAAGDGARFDGPGIKQLMSIDGDFLICRIVRQVKERGYYPIVLTTNDTISEVLRYHCPVHYPAFSRYLLETILHAPIQWAGNFERHVVLLGDCIFTPAALNTIFVKHKRPQFYGDAGEIFAFAFMPDSIYGWLQKGVKIAEDNPKWPYGKLWTLYRMMSGLPLDRQLPMRNHFFTWIVDGTTDIDTMEEYERFQTLIADKGLLT